MLTPQEVSERAFAKASFGGYNMAQVDEFLDILTGDYTALYNENAVLKSKMKVLVDKVDEYRSTEEAMRKALMTAQRMADDMVREAEEKKAALLAQAEEEAQKRLGDLAKEREAEEYRLEQAKASTAAFVAQLRTLYAGQAEFLNKLSDLAPVEAAVEADPVDEAVSEIDDNVQRLLAKAMAEATIENQKLDAQEQAEDLEDTAEFPAVTQEELAAAQEEEKRDFSARTSRIDFGELQFGRDYEIK